MQILKKMNVHTLEKYNFPKLISITFQHQSFQNKKSYISPQPLSEHCISFPLESKIETEWTTLNQKTAEIKMKLKRFWYSFLYYQNDAKAKILADKPCLKQRSEIVGSAFDLGKMCAFPCQALKSDLVSRFKKWEMCIDILRCLHSIV